MAPFAGKTVRLESYGLDAESAILGFQIKSSLVLANINVDETGLMTRASGGSIAFGIHVTGKDSSLVHELITALNGANIKSTPDDPFPHGGVSLRVIMPATPPDAIVFVGIKPITE